MATLSLHCIDTPDKLAVEISNKWVSWSFAKQGKNKDYKELQDYLFATDTRTTQNKALDWKNSTTTPKLTQIRENLHANYKEALFPHKDWLQFVGDGEENNTKQKKVATTLYMKHLLEQSRFEQVIDALLLDWIDHGNAFVGVTYESRSGVAADGSAAFGYSGPKAYRVSPIDIVFDPTATAFSDSPTITRSVMSVGDLALSMTQGGEDAGWRREAYDKLIADRADVQTAMSKGRGFRKDTLDKHQRLQVDGFGSVTEYMSGNLVEILEFEGSIYDSDNDELMESHKIIVIDRSFVIYAAPYTSWTMEKKKYHSGWRKRPDNLWAMGPLDNLVGMQYRIDHTENLKADIFDLIAHPITIIEGDVEWNGWGPGSTAILGENSNIRFEAPQAIALNANLEIQELERRMEELAGAPKDAMGIRTPGEKTKFEVSQLQNAAGRLFQAKLKQFEQELLEPLLNALLQEAVRNFPGDTEIQVDDPELGVTLFQTVTSREVSGKGKLVPVGARHFARQAQLAQDLSSLMQFKQDPTVGVHISGYKIAEILEEMLNMQRFDLVRKNVAIIEQFETQQMTQTAQEELAIEADEPSELTEEDIQAELADGVLEGLESEDDLGGGTPEGEGELGLQV